VRILEFSKDTATRVKSAVDALAKSGAIRCVVDIRGTAKGDLDDGIATARLFVKTGTLAVRAAKTQQETITATEADGAIAPARGVAGRSGHVGSRGGLCGGPRRERPGRSDRRAHAGPRRAPAARQTARR
jgi:hypothetical protein